MGARLGPPGRPARRSATKPGSRPAWSRASARGLRPKPSRAGKDRGRLYDDGCLADNEDVRSDRCTYGARKSDRTVVLYGDSHAMQYFPALQPLIRKRHWRFVGLTKAGCPPGIVSVWSPRLDRDYRECDRWRRNTLRRIEKRERPEMILVSGASFYAATKGGRKVGGEKANRVRMQRGYDRVLERLRETGAKVVVIKDLAFAPHHMPDCIAEHRKVKKCAFKISESRQGGFDVRAARRAGGIPVVDVIGEFCPRGRCRPVIDRKVVFRGTNHLTATYARTLAGAFARQLPKLGG